MEQVKFRYLELVTMLERKQESYLTAGQYEARELSVEMDDIRRLINLHESILDVNEL